MSDTIQMQVYSRPTEEQINDNLPVSTDSLEYLPWGTRSLKLKVSGDYSGKCYLRPRQFILNESPVAGYADGSPGGDIRVSWGGGWEEGFQIEDKKKGEDVYIYFNITHRGTQAADAYPLTLEAYHSKKHTKLGELTVTLHRPAELPSPALKPQWQALGDGDKELLLAPAQARQVPIYLSRWWPTEVIHYTAAQVTVLPRVRLVCHRNIGEGYSRVEIFAALPGKKTEKLLAFIDGDIQFPLVDLEQISADLYFMSGHWVLRVWFFWLDKTLMGKVDTAGLGDAEVRVLNRWRAEQEIPDAERVDIVFDQNLNTRFMCTDLHWQELWGPFTKKAPLHVSVAAEEALNVYIRGAQGLAAVKAALLKKYVPQADKTFDPSEEVKNQLYQQEEGAEKGVGDLKHKHTPFFRNAGFDLDLISNDVRKG